MPEPFVLCGSTCRHNHDSPNGPSGCCDKHGPYLYSCPDCQADWVARRISRKENPDAEA